MSLRFDKLLWGEAAWRVDVGRGRACRIKSAVTVSDRDLTAAASSHQPSAELQFCRVCTLPITSSQLFTRRSQKFRIGVCWSMCPLCVFVQGSGALVYAHLQWLYKYSFLCVCVCVVLCTHPGVKDRLRAWVRMSVDETLFMCVCKIGNRTEAVCVSVCEVLLCSAHCDVCVHVCVWAVVQDLPSLRVNLSVGKIL